MTDSFVYEEVADLKAWRLGGRGAERVVPRAQAALEGWSFVPDASRAVRDKLESLHPLSLEEVADIFVGVQTSKDKLYQIEPVRETAKFVWFVDRDGEERKIERAILRPSLYKVTVEPYEQPVPNAYLAFPYELVKDGQTLTAVPHSPARMRNEFPCALDYFKSHRVELSERNGVGSGGAYYRYGRSQNLTRMVGPKIIVSVLAREARYGPDHDDLIVTGGGHGGPYFLIRPKDPVAYPIEYLLAILNHPATEAIVRSDSQTYANGYYYHNKQTLVGVRVPGVDAAVASSIAGRDAVVSRTRALQASLASMRAAKTPAETLRFSRLASAQREGLDSFVTSLLGITDLDVVQLQTR